ncbi:MAG: protein phosphatase CheZ [Alphaproteobacteria bacterium]
MLKDLRELVQFIHQAKSEIAAIRPDEIKSQHLLVASDELDAIVSATEDATNEIMEAAEAVESISGDLAPAHQEVLGDAVTRIYQACSFQDITGQRISKVVGALKQIETKVEGMLTLLGGREASILRVGRAVEVDSGQADDDPEAKLLNGPQLPGNATSQDEIDALFG